MRRIARWLLVTYGWIPLVAQTQVDLRTQSKSVDFRTAQSTKPLKSGSTLPATCVVGEMFFLETAAPGLNVYGCPAVNTWVVESGGGGVTTIQQGGTPVGARPILDLSTGSGILLALSDTGQAITIQSSLDTSVAQTQGAAQAGDRLRCSSASASATAYTCSMTPVLGHTRPGWCCTGFRT